MTTTVLCVFKSSDHGTTPVDYTTKLQTNQTFLKKCCYFAQNYRCGPYNVLTQSYLGVKIYKIDSAIILDFTRSRNERCKKIRNFFVRLVS